MKIMELFYRRDVNPLHMITYHLYNIDMPEWIASIIIQFIESSIEHEGDKIVYRYDIGNLSSFTYNAVCKIIDSNENKINYKNFWMEYWLK